MGDLCEDMFGDDSDAQDVEAVVVEESDSVSALGGAGAAALAAGVGVGRSPLRGKPKCKAKAASKKVEKEVLKCLCCPVDVYPDKLYCRFHAATVDYVKRKMKGLPQEERQRLTAMEKDKKSEKSEWIQMLLRIEKECPSLGEKKHRAMFAFLVFLREHVNSVGTRKKVHARFMTKPQFVRFATEQKGMSSQEAGEEWVGMLQNDVWPRDNLGWGSALRLLIHMHDDVEVYNDSSQRNVLRAEEQRIRNPDAQTIAAMQRSVQDSPGEFSSEFFVRTAGGDLAQALAQGGKMFITTAGGMNSNMGVGFERNRDMSVGMQVDGEKTLDVTKVLRQILGAGAGESSTSAPSTPSASGAGGASVDKSKVCASPRSGGSRAGAGTPGSDELGGPQAFGFLGQT